MDTARNNTSYRAGQDSSPVLTRDAFLAWEATSRDTIDVKRAYIDIAGDLVAGVLLSQIIFWFLPNKNGEEKITVHKDGRDWLAKKRESWWCECRITPKQFDRSVALLEAKSLIVTRVYKFDGDTVKHVSVEWDALINQLSGLISTRKQCELPKGKFLNSSKVNSGIPERGIPYKGITETTTEITHTDDVSVCVDQLRQILSGPFGSVDPMWIWKQVEGASRSIDDVIQDLDRLVFQYTIGGDQIRKQPEALISTAIKKGWAAPQGYVPQAQRQAQASQKREAAEQQAEKKRREEEAASAEYKAAETKLSALPDQEREKIFAEAKSHLPAFLKKSKIAIKNEAIRLMMPSARSPG